MLLTRMVDQCACRLHEEGQNDFIATCRGYEAAQVGSAVCIEVGKDFTLPYYRDLGVVLTIGMTPYEVLRTYTQALQSTRTGEERNSEHGTDAHFKNNTAIHHWGYHKHNMVTGPAPVATQVLHAAGIAFACKLRKAPVVTVAYCGDGAAAERDFLEGITFAAHHQLPAIFVYEQDDETSSSLQTLPLPNGLEHHCIDGTDVITVYTTMGAAMQHAREGHGPVLLEMKVHHPTPDPLPMDKESENDPLLICQRYLEEREEWDEEWAAQLKERYSNEIEQAMQDALRDIS
ncbi:MAG: 3-methyl-2-oxobutanoate dehydrogenase subunit alpha [Ktedonobacteraceae bacterium]